MATHISSKVLRFQIMYIILAHNKYSKCSYVHYAIGQGQLVGAGVTDQNLPQSVCERQSGAKERTILEGLSLETCLYGLPPGPGMRQESERGFLGKLMKHTRFLNARHTSKRSKDTGPIEQVLIDYLGLWAFMKQERCTVGFQG